MRPIASLAGRVLRRRKLRPSPATPRFRVNTLRAAVCASKRLELAGNVRLFRPFSVSAFLQQLLRGWTSEAMPRSCALDLNRLALLLGHLLLSPFLLAAISSMTTISQAPPLPPIYFEQQCRPNIRIEARSSRQTWRIFRKRLKPACWNLTGAHEENIVVGW